MNPARSTEKERGKKNSRSSRKERHALLLPYLESWFFSSSSILEPNRLPAADQTTDRTVTMEMSREKKSVPEADRYSQRAETSPNVGAHDVIHAGRGKEDQSKSSDLWRTALSSNQIPPIQNFFPAIKNHLKNVLSQIQMQNINKLIQTIPEITEAA